MELSTSDVIFVSGTQPFGFGSEMCLNFSIVDDQLVEPTERFIVCGNSTQNAVEILSNGCADIKIRDNEGKIVMQSSSTAQYNMNSFSNNIPIFT